MRYLAAIVASCLLLGEKAAAEQTTATEVGIVISAFLNEMTCAEVSSSFWMTGRLMRNGKGHGSVTARDLLPGMIAFVYTKGIEAAGKDSIAEISASAQEFCESNPSAPYINAFK